jgi:hypothetical protein
VYSASILGSPACVHFLSSVSANAVMMKRKMTGDRLSPCLTPTVCWMSVVSLPILSVIRRSEYNRWIAFVSFGGAPNFSSVCEMRVWLDVSNALTRSANTTYLSRLCWRRRCRNVLRVKFPSWHPELGVAPNWYLVPCLLRRLYNLLVSIRLKTFDPTSMRFTIRNWFGLDACVVFGTGIPCPLCHSWKSVSLFQKSLMKLNRMERFLLFIALNASAGISLAPGDLLFFRPLMALVNSFHVIGSSSDEV